MICNSFSKKITYKKKNNKEIISYDECVWVRGDSLSFTCLCLTKNYVLNLVFQNNIFFLVSIDIKDNYTCI